jgi:hypothetical protein
MCNMSTFLTASFQLRISVHMLQFIQTMRYENKKQWRREGGTQQQLSPYSDTAVTVFCDDMWNDQFLATCGGAFCMSTITQPRPLSCLPTPSVHGIMRSEVTKMVTTYKLHSVCHLIC